MSDMDKKEVQESVQAPSETPFLVVIVKSKAEKKFVRKLDLVLMPGLSKNSFVNNS